MRQGRCVARGAARAAGRAREGGRAAAPLTPRARRGLLDLALRRRASRQRVARLALLQHALGDEPAARGAWAAGAGGAVVAPSRRQGHCARRRSPRSSTQKNKARPRFRRHCSKREQMQHSRRARRHLGKQKWARRTRRFGAWFCASGSEKRKCAQNSARLRRRARAQLIRLRVLSRASPPAPIHSGPAAPPRLVLTRSGAPSARFRPSAAPLPLALRGPYQPPNTFCCCWRG